MIQSNSKKASLLRYGSVKPGLAWLQKRDLLLLHRSTLSADIYREKASGVLSVSSIMLL